MTFDFPLKRKLPLSGVGQGQYDIGLLGVLQNIGVKYLEAGSFLTEILSG